MKLLGSKSVLRTSAFSLVECLIYIAVLMVVTGIAFSVFFSLLTHHRNIARCSEDILHAMKAGERWRADVRLAAETPILESNATEQAMHIRQMNGTITYLFSEGSLWRIQKEKKTEELLLEKVKSSLISADTRTYVHAWRWDLELVITRKKAKITPLFSFLAVEPATATNQSATLVFNQAPSSESKPVIAALRHTP